MWLKGLVPIKGPPIFRNGSGDSGACLVEYGLLAALIAVSIMAIVQHYMKDTSTSFLKTGCVLQGKPDKDAPAWGNDKRVNCYKLLTERPN